MDLTLYYFASRVFMGLMAHPVIVVMICVGLCHLHLSLKNGLVLALKISLMNKWWDSFSVPPTCGLLCCLLFLSILGQLFSFFQFHDFTSSVSLNQWPRIFFYGTTIGSLQVKQLNWLRVVCLPWYRQQCQVCVIMFFNSQYIFNLLIMWHPWDLHGEMFTILKCGGVPRLSLPVFG